MSSPEAMIQEKPPKQACDNCRRRKIKCDRAEPCDKCQRLLLSCSYSDILRRKGPKFRTLYPLAPIHPFSTRPADAVPPQPHAYQMTNEGFDHFDFRVSEPTSPSITGLQPHYPLSDFADQPFRLNPPDMASSPGSTASYPSDVSNFAAFPTGRRLTPPVLLAHVNVYLKYLYPIMPIVRQEQLQMDSNHPETLSTQRYAFMAAMCAATHIQLRLDGASAAKSLSTGTDGDSVMSGEELLAEAVRARKKCDVVDEISIESLLTSFFLFAAYGNLNMQDHAWFYLCQSITMAVTLGLHRESTYSNLTMEMAENQRRVFWLLFITERGYALQRYKPVILRHSIHKPQVLCSDDPVIVYGFINLIMIFEKVTVELYDWISAGGGDTLALPQTSSILSSLAKPISSEGILEVQKVDILITQQWLQALMWKLSMKLGSQTSGTDEGVSSHLPLLVAKSVMNVIENASPGAIDAHGIGMEQKLFDMGSSVADAVQSIGTTAAQQLIATVDPQELLWGILNALSRIRGSQSYLFPALLERCQNILNMNCPINIGNYLPTIAGYSTANMPTGSHGDNRWSVVSAIEELSDQHGNDGDMDRQAAPRPEFGPEYLHQQCVF